VLGLHCRDVKASGGNSDKDTVSEPVPKVAVTPAVSVVVTVPRVGMKVALLAPAATVTEAGTVRRELLSLSVTTVLLGAV